MALSLLVSTTEHDTGFELVIRCDLCPAVIGAHGGLEGQPEAVVIFGGAPRQITDMDGETQPFDSWTAAGSRNVIHAGTMACSEACRASMIRHLHTEGTRAYVVHLLDYVQTLADPGQRRARVIGLEPGESLPGDF